MIWKLLRRNISLLQMAGYALSNLVGLAIVIVAVQFYNDAKSALGYGDDSQAIANKDYMILSHPVSMLNTLGLGRGDGASAISQDEIDDLSRQPWVQDVGKFTSANFSVTGSVDLQGRGLWTHLFLESVPDKFMDVEPRGWDADPEVGQEVPIVISKDYLALYNFGFAASRGLPQISEGLISQIPITLYLNGNGHSDQYPARIVGFSSRLNTIAVPQRFMQWANERYSTAPQRDEASRLIVEVNEPGNPAIEPYLRSNGLEVAGDRLDQGRAAYLLTIVTSIVLAIGVVICALSLFILMLSISLLLQKNKTKNASLLLLGYRQGQVAMVYYRLVGAINAGVLALAVGAMLVTAHFWRGPLEQLSVSPSSPVASILCGAAIMAVMTAVNFMAIRRSIQTAE